MIRTKENCSKTADLDVDVQTEKNHSITADQDPNKGKPLQNSISGSEQRKTAPNSRSGYAQRKTAPKQQIRICTKENRSKTADLDQK